MHLQMDENRLPAVRRIVHKPTSWTVSILAEIGEQATGSEPLFGRFRFNLNRQCLRDCRRLQTRQAQIIELFVFESELPFQ